MISRATILLAVAFCLGLSAPAGATGAWGGIADPALGTILASAAPGVAIGLELGPASSGVVGDATREELAGPTLEGSAPVPELAAGILVAILLLALGAGGLRAWQQGAARGRRA